MNRVAFLRSAKVWVYLFLVGMLPLLNTGCLLFEKQTVVIAFPRDRDEVSALIINEGLWPSGKDDKGLKEAKDQLTSLVGSKEFFYLGNPLVVIPVALPKDPAKVDPQEKKWIELMQRHLTIHKGGFLTDKDGKLSYYHTLTLKDASQFVKAANQLVNEIAKEKMAQPAPSKTNPPDPLDEQARLIWLKAAKAGHTWFTMQPGKVSVTVPGTEKVFARFKADAFNIKGIDQVIDRLKRIKGMTEQQREQSLDSIQKQLYSWKLQTQLWAENSWSLVQSKDKVVFSVGVGDGEPIEILFRIATSDAGPERIQQLIQHARSLGVEFHEGRSVQQVIADFLKKNGSPQP